MTLSHIAGLAGDARTQDLAFTMDEDLFRVFYERTSRGLAGYLVRQPPLRTWRTWRKSGTNVGAANYDRSIWLLRDAEELRQMFGLTEMTS